jgi:hypothetical protein
MAESSWPSPDDSRDVSDLEYEQLMAGYVPSGLIGSPGDTAVVTADGSDREVIVRLGKYGYVRGHVWYSGTSNFTVTIAANASGNPRIDLVVLRLTRSTWNVTVEVVQGTPGLSPAVPALTQDLGTTGVYEIPLAEVAVANGAAVIASGDVTGRDYYLGRTPWAGVFANRPASGTCIDQRYSDTTNGWDWVWNGTAWLPASAGFLIANGWRTTSTATTTSEIGVLRIDDVPIYEGRCYEISTSPLSGYADTTSEFFEFRIKYTTDGSTPTTSSSTIPGGISVDSQSNTYSSTSYGPIFATYRPPADQTLSLLLTIRRITGGGNVQSIADATYVTEMRIKDVGPALANMGVAI